MTITPGNRALVTFVVEEAKERMVGLKEEETRRNPISRYDGCDTQAEAKRIVIQYP